MLYLAKAVHNQFEQDQLKTSLASAIVHMHAKRLQVAANNVSAVMARRCMYTK